MGRAGVEVGVGVGVTVCDCTALVLDLVMVTSWVIVRVEVDDNVVVGPGFEMVEMVEDVDVDVVLGGTGALQ